MSKDNATSKISKPQSKHSPSPPPAFIDTYPARSRSHQHSGEPATPDEASWKPDRVPKPRPQSPALPWHKEYSQLDPRCGRVLVIDFLRADQSQNQKRKVVAQELDCLDSLRKLYKHPRRANDGNLRLIHVQNAPWATRFLLRKFNIDGRDDLVGSNFGRYTRFTKPDRRGGKPFPNAKTWRVQHDPWRGIGKTSFGFDYLKEYRVADPTAEGRIFDEKMMELNGYDDEENPMYGNDVYIQRLACYVQHKEDPPSPSFDGANGISNPYKVQRPGREEGRSHKHYLPQLSALDNEDAIIIFDNSQSGSFEDCLIPARSEWETHWRRLPFYLAYEAREIVGHDELLGRQCARMILDDVFRALFARWESLLDACHIHVSILEDKIYEQPADETRAPELWRNSSLWLSLEKLTTAHMAVVREMRIRLRELVTDFTQPGNASNIQNSNTGSELNALINDDDWLEHTPDDLDRIASAVDEDLVKPTQSLISLLYQSVSIRDSRLSLQLDTSMWRLSWITFIFLPLTFMVGFFGMNVDTFAGNPSLKWYFIVSVPFMILILASWYIMKHILARQRQTPYQRGTYESFFHNLAVKYPRLWSRVGPREYIVPRTRLDQWKWWLIKRWTRPERTIKAGQANADTAAPNSLSRWARIKMTLIRHWTSNLTTFGSQADIEMQSTDDDTDEEQGSALVEGLFDATELLTVPGQPVATAMMERLQERQEAEQQQHRHHHNQEQPSKSTADSENENTTNNLSAAAYSPTPNANELSLLQLALRSDGSAQSANADNQIGRANSPRGRKGPRPTSSGGGSSDSRSRNSSVLVEEEDPRWINQLAKQGRGWYWRPTSQSPSGGRSPGSVSNNRNFGDGRRGTGYSSGASRPIGFPTPIEKRVGDGGSSSAAATATAVIRGEEANNRVPSPLGVVHNTANLGDDDDDEYIIETHDPSQQQQQLEVPPPALPVSDPVPSPPPPAPPPREDGDEQHSSSSCTSNDEAVRAAEETAGRAGNSRIDLGMETETEEARGREGSVDK